VASDSTCWRVVDAIGKPEVAAIGRAREVAWAQRAEITGSVCPPARACGRELPGLVIDLDATRVVCHSDKEQTVPTFKHTFGDHPMVAFIDDTGEAVAAMLRLGNAGAIIALCAHPLARSSLLDCPGEGDGSGGNTLSRLRPDGSDLSGYSVASPLRFLSFSS
jgi:hypothetical protein